MGSGRTPTQPDQAPARLLILAQFEEFAGWFLDRTRRWPKHARFTLTQRLENHALDIVEHLVQARYDRDTRTDLLHRVNLLLERMRHLLRLALRQGVCPANTFETTHRRLDETGRMLHGWRRAIGDQAR